MDIKPVDQTIKTLLESSFYRIPRFQRPYSWDRENVADFWNDAVTSEDPDYFIGSFVVYRGSAAADTLLVVDGQQRITTITLLLAGLRDILREDGHDDLAKGIQLLIERPDLNNEKQYVLQSESPYPYLQEHIQKYGEPELPPSSGAEEDALRDAYTFLKGQLRSVVEAVTTDALVAPAKKLEKRKARLLSVRDKLMRLQLILIQLTSEDDAYLIFETLNTRGKDLTVSDLVKNHLTRTLKIKNKGVDVAREKWEGIRTLFDESSEDIDINRFLHHSWLSRHPYLPEKKLFKEIKRSVGRTTAQELLGSTVRRLEDLPTDCRTVVSQVDEGRGSNRRFAKGACSIPSCPASSDASFDSSRVRQRHALAETDAQSPALYGKLSLPVQRNHGSTHWRWHWSHVCLGCARAGGLALKR